MKPRRCVFAGALLSFALLFVGGLGSGPVVTAQPRGTIHQATLGEVNPITPELSAEELQRLMAPGAQPVVLTDTRPAMEYAFAHIPGAISVGENEEEHITRAFPDKGTPMVLYCNGPY